MTTIRVGILTASDKGSRGERADESGRVIAEMLVPLGAEVLEYQVVPDERAVIAQKLKYMADELGLDLVLTTGGTGLSPRDWTPDATLDVVERQVPGIAEAMRARTSSKTPRAMLSRAVAGIRGQTLMVNLPGSPKAVRECLEVILPAIPHAIEVLRGEASECARLDP